MARWSTFTPSNFEYNFEDDKLAAHRVAFEAAVECFFSDFEIRKKRSSLTAFSLWA